MSTSSRQQGAATLIVTLVMFFALALVVALSNRTLLFEQRSVANEVHAQQALDAAEAGLEWTVAMLDETRAVGADCLASTEATAANFRQRALTIDAASGHFVPRSTAPVASCVRQDAGGWACRCAPAALAAPATPDGRAAFTVRLEAGPQNTVGVIATGCTHLAGPCVDGGSDVVDGTARSRVLLALVPGLAAPPAAPLVARGDVEAGSAALGLVNATTATGGIVIDAGGKVVAPSARVTTAPGASSALAIVEGDKPLSGSGADSLFARHFGMDRATWAQQSVVRHLACAADCGSQLVAAVAEGAQLLWVDGDAQIDGPLSLGTPGRPVILVADGALTFTGAVAMQGVAYGHRTGWSSSATGGALAGALISETGYSGDGAPELRYDASVITTLMTTTGSFVRVPGSWRDFE